ncbi:hypothetical protein RGQ13_01650 [Thalassotalea psychrophila]|uniref:Uncharacterized protein n=1 Tax=Thalassotalea psychrophila TaxID=3065647 RepID=A0ABY9TW41_9GAMM|nr:hypothetical protein RGQ13_01650 [Colwelliaceae bacterium SQ149]
MKKLLFLIAVIATLSGCRYGNDKRSIFWDDQNRVSITRQIEAESSDNWTLASCIAVPSAWDTPLTVNINGSYQVENITTKLDTIPETYSDGVIEMSTHYPMPGYDWHCYIDVARDFADTDEGEIEFSFAPEEEVSVVYTSIGVVSEERRSEHYHGNVVSHQLLASDTYTAYWKKQYAIADLSYWQTFAIGDDTLIFDNTNYYTKGTELLPLYRFNHDDGLKRLADMPKTELLYMVNGIYISQNNFDAEIEGNEQAWTDISFSTNFETWSSPVTLPHIAKVQWDPRDKQYIAISNDHNTPMVNTTYQSKDLITWTENQWIDMQSPNVAFLNDGTAVLETTNPSDPYKIRDPLTDEWTSLNIMPTDGVTGSVLFLSHGIFTHNNRLYTTGLRRIDGQNESELYGYSDNGQDWFWSVIGLYEDVGFTFDLIFLPNDIIIHSTSGALMVSSNNGNTWLEKNKPTSLFNEDKLSGVYQNGTARNITTFEDGYIGTTGIHSGSPTRTTALFKTQDFVTYEFLTLSGNIEPITSTNKLLFLEGTLDGVEIQALTQPSPDNDLDGISDSDDIDDDNDGVADDEDTFPLDEHESVDTDSDGTGNNSDSDDDNDGVADADDAFPLDATESIDTDKDGQGNNSDTDDDNDGVADADDAFPLDATESIDTDKDGQGNNSDTDDDNDGVADADDAFPLDGSMSADVEDSKSSSSGGALNFGLLISFFFLVVTRNSRIRNSFRFKINVLFKGVTR